MNANNISKTTAQKVMPGVESSQNKESVSPLPRKTGKHLQIFEKTWVNNNQSDYTEKIRDLGKAFNYSANSNYYWGPAELSLLYGTPVYEAASSAQKLALNHLYWAGTYNYTAFTETSTIDYNTITADVFEAVGGYDTLCQELALESEQERYHIRTFQNVAVKTKIAILGKKMLGNPFYKKSKTLNTNGSLTARFSQPLQKILNGQSGSLPLAAYRDRSLRVVAKTMLRDKKNFYSKYLQEIESQGKPISAMGDGIAGDLAPASLLRFFSLNWGISPFMACQYYSMRYTGNVRLKNQEYPYVKYLRQLEKKGEFVPSPTAISYYHLLDEAFHTTISQTITKEMYKDLPKPTAYEKFLSGQMIKMMQQNLLSGLSGVVLNQYVADSPELMLYIYKILKSPLFEMSTPEAMGWIEKSFCQEHEGFHVSLKYHKSLLESMQRLFGSLDYQWEINREMKIMAAGASISKALQNNIRAFNQFRKYVG